MAILVTGVSSLRTTGTYDVLSNQQRCGFGGKFMFPIGTPAGVGTMILMASTGGIIRIFTTANSGWTFTIRAADGTDVGFTTAHVPRPGEVIDFAMSWDAIAGLQQFWINGVLQLISNGAQHQNTETSTYSLRTALDTFPPVIGEAIVLSTIWATQGYAPTAADIALILAGQTPQSVFGPALAWNPSLAGAPGTTVEVDDPGLLNLNGSLGPGAMGKYNFTFIIGTGTITYTNDLVFGTSPPRPTAGIDVIAATAAWWDTQTWDDGPHDDLMGAVQRWWAGETWQQ